MVFTKDDMDAFQPKFTGMFAVFLPSALKALAKYTCDAFEPESEGMNVVGYVEYDGLTVRLPYWFTNVRKARIGSKDVAYTFTPDHEVYAEDGAVMGRFGRTITLVGNPVAAGTMVYVDGTHGFEDYPYAVKAFIARLIVELSKADNGDNRVKSKAIEDVNVTYTDGSAALTPFGRALQGFQSLLDDWRLCDGWSVLGMIDMPRQCVKRPYWLGEAEYL